MNIELLESAKDRIGSVPVLVNMISKRVRQLNSGFRPMVKPALDEETVDVCLREIVDGKLISEVDFSASPEGDL